MYTLYGLYAEMVNTVWRIVTGFLQTWSNQVIWTTWKSQGFWWLSGNFDSSSQTFTHVWMCEWTVTKFIDRPTVLNWITVILFRVPRGIDLYRSQYTGMSRCPLTISQVYLSSLMNELFPYIPIFVSSPFAFNNLLQNQLRVENPYHQCCTSEMLMIKSIMT